MTVGFIQGINRFYESHQANPIMHMLTIADAINLRDLPPFRLKARMKKALEELKRVGYLRDIKIDRSGIAIKDYEHPQSFAISTFPGFFILNGQIEWNKQRKEHAR